MTAGSRFLVCSIGADEVADGVVRLDRLPGVTPESAEHVVLQLGVVEVPVVDVRDLELAAPRRLELGQHPPYRIVVEVHAGHGEVAGRFLRLLDDPRDPAVAVELGHAQVPEVLGVRLLGEHDTRAPVLVVKRLDTWPQRALEHVVGQEDHAAVAVHELFGESQSLCDPASLVLVGVEEALDPELLAVAKQAKKLARVRAAGHEHDLRHPGADQGFDAVADHGSVVKRQQVLVGDPGQWMQPAAGAAGEYDALHRPRIIVQEMGGDPPQQSSTPRPATMFSPDGFWWWDGTQWKAAVYPDRLWRWNGQAWEPNRQIAAPPRPGGGGVATAAIVTVLGFFAVLVLVSIFTIVVLLTMGNQLANVFSNVVAALGANPRQAPDPPVA